MFADAASAFGTEVAARGLRLVYGGGSVGLMGVVADAALARGGEVVGVLPRDLFAREVAHSGLTELRQVAGMHERKAEMERLSDAFVALPGGLGTLDEFFEMATWAQLGIHHKPLGVLEVGDFFTPLRAYLTAACEAGFIAPEHLAPIAFAREPGKLLERLAGAWRERTG